MGRLHKLFNKFTNRKKRSESDCAVVQEIVDCYQSCADESSRKESLKWLFKTMEDKGTKEIARTRIAFLLTALQDTLPDKKRRRLEKYQRKIEKKKDRLRAKNIVSEKTVAKDRIERKKKEKDRTKAA